MATRGWGCSLLTWQFVLVVESLTCNVIVEYKGGKDACKGWWRPFIEIILVTYVLKKHREISCECRENTGNLIFTRTWLPC